MAITRGLFMSERPDWETPPAVFEYFNKQYRFTLDVCATPANAKCARYFTMKENGLARSWAGERCWCNPPYGRAIGDWLRKAADEGDRAPVICCLIPARTDTAWWHDHVAMHAKVIFLRGRVRFVGGAGAAPFPSAVAIFGQEAELLPRVAHVDLRGQQSSD